MHDTLSNRKHQGYEPLSEHQLLEIENNCRKYIDGSVEEIEIHSLRQVQATFSAFKRVYKYINRSKENLILHSVCCFYFIKRQMEKDVEAKFRERYTMIDKTDAEQIAEAQKVSHFYHFLRMNF
jgi:kinesin family protein 6/9